MKDYSYINNADPTYVDHLYETYKKDPTSVDVSWRTFFEGYDFSLTQHNGLAQSESAVGSDKEGSVRSLIHAYRTRGHLRSKTNPIRARRNHKVLLHYTDYGLADADLDTPFEAGKDIGIGVATLRTIIAKLDNIYLGSIGFEYGHIRNREIVEWFFEKCETDYQAHTLGREEKKQVLVKLNEAVVFENFLHTKFLGQKRFSLEGGENTICFLQTLINKAVEGGIKEVAIGMAHRGRLNVLANILEKTYEQIFNEFEGIKNSDMMMGGGDVKYHQGYASHIAVLGKKIYVKLMPNPSHLEAVDPLILGYIRGQIDDEYAGNFKKAMPILIHGDAAIAGQGITYETAQMSELEGYHVGGTIHFVINNQIGFTTDYDDARSSIYCTDVAKIIDAPVLHVNGDDAEAIVFCAKLAIAYRQKFGKDIYVDMLCYRKYGHNESDEPKFTQPKLYNFIAKHPNPRKIYLDKLIEKGDMDATLADGMDKKFRHQLQDRLNQVKQEELPYKIQKVEEEWSKMRQASASDFEVSPDTSITQHIVDKVGKALASVPDSFTPLKQIQKLLKDRKVAFFETKKLGWGEAELLAYGSLLMDGTTVRISGQDVRRGTFSHRHAYLADSVENEFYCNLDHIDKKQRKLYIYNSLLSEFGVLGFEYGYAMASPNALVIWEAQFGDFANGAQTVVDQFLSSAESKWQRMNGLVMLLPHGYEGQGPEHSNARPERFLQLAAEYNMVITNPTTSANFFHLLRRQVAWNFRKPCIVFSPKSLLRHPSVASPVSAFTHGKFCELAGDITLPSPTSIKRLVFCSGKLCYDLEEARLKNKSNHIALVRLEQLYPFPTAQVTQVIKRYSKAKLVWAQEEPANMGSLAYIQRMMPASIFAAMEIVSRKSSASPATGYAKAHKTEQEHVVHRALGINS